VDAPTLTAQGTRKKQRNSKHNYSHKYLNKHISGKPYERTKTLFERQILAERESPMQKVRKRLRPRRHRQIIY